MLTRYLRDGTEYLSASTVRRVVQVASMSVVGSAIAVSRLDKEVLRVTTTYLDEDPVTLADHMVRMCEEEVLDWMRTRTAHPGPDADPDPAGSPTGQELVKDLEKILAKKEADKYPPPGSKEDAWMVKVLEQATRVHCFAEEICDETAKRDWQLCAYQLYRWQMDQEVGHLYALFGGPEEDEVRVKGQRLAKAWMDKAVDSVERARRRVGLRFQGASELDGARQCHHDGPPMESRPCEIQARTAIQRADRAWRKGPGASRSSAASSPTERADQLEAQSRWKHRTAALGFHQALRTAGVTQTALSPATSALQTQSGTPSLQRPGQRGSGHQRPNQRILSRPCLSHQRLSPRIPTRRRLSRRIPTHLTWRRGEGARSLPTRATPTPPPPPPTQRSRTRAAPTQALRSRLHQTPREISLLRHRP
jgi:hypothetical protein